MAFINQNTSGLQHSTLRSPLQWTHLYSSLDSATSCLFPLSVHYLLKEKCKSQKGHLEI